MATGSSPRSRRRAASATATSVLPIPVGPKMASTAALKCSGGAGEQALAAGERGAGGGLDLDLRQRAGRRQAGEVGRLVVAGAAAQPGPVGARRALHAPPPGAAGEPLGALVGPPPAPR